MTDATMPDTAFLASLLTELRLPSIARNWRRIAEVADRDGWPAQKTIAALMEMTDRDGYHTPKEGGNAGKPVEEALERMELGAQV